MEITDFLLQRIAEDEAAARAADSGRWLPEDKGITFEFYGDEFPDGEAQSRLTADTKANMNHIARHDPARVLAECAAKRAIIEQAGEATSDRYYVIGNTCVTSAERDAEEASDPGALILRALAAVYKDHHDYQETWG